MSLPLVCVCVPCYNAEKTIVETLKSIQKQTYKNIEIHVFDNASTDQTLKRAQEVDDKRIFLHRAKETGTAESNFTRCLNLGRGDYTAIYHADDLYVPTIVEKEVDFLEKNKQAGGVLTLATQINGQGKPLGTYLAPKSLGMKIGESRVFDCVTLFKAVLRHDNFLFCPSAMIRTKVCVDEIKYWRGDLFKSSADLDVWLRLAELGGLGLINEPLLFYRISDEQWTANYRKKRRGRADIFLVSDYWLNKEIIRSNLSRIDRESYRKLQKYDALGRILNAIRAGDVRFGLDLWKKESFSVLSLLWYARSLKDFKFLLLGVFLRLMLSPILGKALVVPLLGVLNKVRL